MLPRVALILLLQCYIWCSSPPIFTNMFGEYPVGAAVLHVDPFDRTCRTIQQRFPVLKGRILREKLDNTYVLPMQAC